MSLTFTPHWAFPTLFVLFTGLLVSVFTGGCVASVDGIESESTPAAEACGGSVCFAPTDVAVKHWGDGDLTVVAWRADDLGCDVPHGPPAPAEGPTTKAFGVIGGTAIEVELHAAKPGARLPLYTREHAKDVLLGEKTAPWATAHAVRIGKSDGRALADEETVSGVATILDLDAKSGRVRVRLDAKWSSGVTSGLLFDIDGPHTCTASH